MFPNPATMFAPSPADRWRADRDEATRLLAMFGRRDLLSCIPDMLVWYAAEQCGEEDASDSFSGLAFDMVHALDGLMHGQRDADTGHKCDAHLMEEAHVTQRVLVELQRADLPEDVMDRVRAVRAAFGVEEAKHADADADADVSSYDYIIVPAVLGADAPLLRQDVEVVLSHLRKGDDATAAKLTAAFVARNAHNFVVRFNSDGVLHVPAFRALLTTLVDTVPSLLYRALSAMGLLGPAVYAPGASRELLPRSWRPVESTSLALQYAKHLEGVYEGAPGGS